MAQPGTGGVRTTEGEGDKLEMPSDNEEITIDSTQDSADIRNVDTRDEQSENTQRENWLLPTEPRHGARPRQTGGERPPAMEDSVLSNVCFRRPTSEWDPPPGRGRFHTPEGGQSGP